LAKKIYFIKNIGSGVFILNPDFKDRNEFLDWNSAKKCLIEELMKLNGRNTEVDSNIEPDLKKEIEEELSKRKFKFDKLYW